MDEPKNLQSVGAAATGVKQQVSGTAADAKQKLTDAGRDAAGQLSDVAQTATTKVKAAAEYLRETEFAAMVNDVKDIVGRYPGWSLAAAAAVGFLIAHMRSRD
jgi:ElaB/YqjD/DUF883 family membrane-anchored ribosome-binding protein